jgi:hypothetical protein
MITLTQHFVFYHTVVAADQCQQQAQAAVSNVPAQDQQGSCTISHPPLMACHGQQQASHKELQQSLSSSPAVTATTSMDVSSNSNSFIQVSNSEDSIEFEAPCAVCEPTGITQSQHVYPLHRAQSRHVRFASQLPTLQLAPATHDPRLNYQQSHLATSSAAAGGSSSLSALAASGIEASPLQTATRRTPVPPQEAAPISARQYTARRRYSSGSISEQPAIRGHGSPEVSSALGSRRSSSLLDKEKECYFSDPEPDTDGARGRRIAAGAAAGVASRFKLDSCVGGSVTNSMVHGQASLPAVSPVSVPGTSASVLPFEHLVSSPVGGNSSSKRKGVDSFECMAPGSKHMPVPPPAEELGGKGHVRPRPSVLRNSCSCLT